MLNVIYFISKFFCELYLSTGQITSGKSFPKALTEEEEKKYIKKYYIEGDKSARDILIERNLRLVAHIVKKYTKVGDDCEDLISIGTIGLIKAVDTFDYKKNKRMATYAARCINNEILMQIRSDKKNRYNIYLSDSIGMDKDGDEITYEETIVSSEAAPDVYLEQKTEKLYLMNRAMKSLTPKECEIICMRYGFYNDKCSTQQQVADKMDISRSYVSRIEKKALQKLREEFKRDN